jgi:hypothetical protein
MPQQPPNPVTKKGLVKAFDSPKVGDFVFFELVNSKLPKYKNPPEYGTKHPCTEKYPNHELVFIAPASGMEDHWQKWYYAACRSDQDDYNFVKDDDKVTRTYLIPRDEFLDGTYTPQPAEGDADPEFAGYEFSGEVVVKRVRDRVLDGAFVEIELVYAATDPEDKGTSDRGTGRGEVCSSTTESATKLADCPESYGIVVSQSSTYTEDKLWRNTEERMNLREGVNGTSVSNKVGYVETSTTEFSATEPVQGDESNFSNTLVTTDVNGADAVWKASRSDRVSDPATGNETTNYLGGGLVDVDISLVPDSTAADEGHLVLSSTVKPIGNGEAIRVTKTLPEYPTLVEEKYDPSLDACVRITKDVVDPSTNPTCSYAAGDVTEIQAVDKWRSVRIRTEGLGVEKTETLPGVFQFRFPPVLRGAEWKWSYAWAFNATNNAYDADSAIIFDVKEAYSAAVEGRTIRVVTGDPTSVVGSYPPTVFRPESHTLASLVAYAYASDNALKARASARTWQTPMALSAAIYIVPPPFDTGLTGIDIEGWTVSDIPATTPTDIPSGWITIGVSTRRLRLGYYEVLVKQINSPGP